MNHVLPFGFGDKFALRDLHPQAVTGIRGKPELPRGAAEFLRPLVFRPQIGLGGLMKIAVFNIRPQNELNRPAVFEPAGDLPVGWRYKAN